MKHLLYYLLQVIVASGILYGYYHLALRNKKFHRYNRFYLLAATVVSITIPFLNIPVYFTQSETDSSFVLQTLTVISSTDPGNPIVGITKPENHTSWFTWQNLSFLFYILIASFIFIRIIFSLLKIRRIVKNNPAEQLDKIHFINTTEPGTPFSFFRWLFWNKKIELQSEKGEQIFRHELFHIEQKHSSDIMYLELLTVLCWINPFFHLIKKEVKAIHEFLADQFAITENKKWEYAELLLMQVLNTQQQLVNPFFHNQIKRRIAMITTSKKPSQQYLRKLMVFPVAAIVIGLFAFSYKEKIKADEKEHLLILEQVNLADTTRNSSVNKITLIGDFNPAVKKSPTSEKIKIWSFSKTYRVWLDNKRITNAELSKYKSSDFSLYNVIKNETSTKNHDDHFYQVNLWTNEWYEKSQKNKIAGTEKRYVIVKDTTKPLLGNGFEKALIVIDGVIRNDISTDNINENVNTNNIESITVLKDESAIAKYGVKGKNGVIEIITKKNTANEIKEVTVSEKKSDGADNKIFTKTETDPSFPGGEAKWKQYQKVALKQFIPSQRGAPVGTYTVIVQFIVKKDSFITDVKALTNHGFGMEEEAIRLISKGPRWIPAMQNGRQVTAYWKQPVTFYVTSSTSQNIPPDNKNFTPTPYDTSADGSKALFIIDGKIQEGSNILDKLNPNDIESMNVLKGTTAINKYGDKGKNGVIEIFTKKGKTNEIKEITLEEKKPDLPGNKIEKSQTPQITLAQLKKATPLQLLQLPEGTEVISYKFSIDTDNGDIVETTNTGNQFNAATKLQIARANADKTIILESIRIMKDGLEKKIPSKVYAVVN